MGSTISMAILTVYIFIFSVATGVLADTLTYKTYAGLERKIEMSPSVMTAMSQLNRYCGNGNYHYTPTYYRPSYHGPSTGNLGTLLMFGLATAATVAGGVALATSLFPSTTIVGRKYSQTKKKNEDDSDDNASSGSS